MVKLYQLFTPDLKLFMGIGAAGLLLKLAKLVL